MNGGEGDRLTRGHEMNDVENGPRPGRDMR